MARLFNVYDHTKKVPTFNGKPWRECMDELEEWDIGMFEDAEKQNAKPRIQRWAENKAFTVRMKVNSVKSVIRQYRQGMYFSATESLVFLLPGRWYSEDQDEHEAYVKWGPLTVTRCSVLDHNDVELSMIFRKTEYSYRWVFGDEPIRSSGWNVYNWR